MLMYVWGDICRGSGGPCLYVCGLLDHDTDTDWKRRVMHSQCFIHTWSTPRNVIPLMAVSQLTGLNDKRGKNPKDINKKREKKKKQKARRRQINAERKEEREGDVFLSREHNTGGVKFQQASVVQSHIPAKGMCGQGVWGRRAIDMPSGSPCDNWLTPGVKKSGGRNERGWRGVRWRRLCKVSDTCRQTVWAGQILGARKPEGEAGLYLLRCS